MQPDSAFWNKKRKTRAVKTKTAPSRKKDKPTAVTDPAAVGESAEADDQSEVETWFLLAAFLLN